MNIFQRARLREIRRAAYDAGQWVGPGNMALDESIDIQRQDRIRWAFDPKTAVLLSLGIILITFWLIWDASATSPYSDNDSLPGATQAIGADQIDNEPAEASNRKGKRSTGARRTNADDGAENLPPGAPQSPQQSNAESTLQRKGVELRDAPETINRTITVHVAGAVKKPGIVHVPKGARVYEAVERAGGISQEGISDSINLAAVIADGEYVYIPNRDQVSSGNPGIGEQAFPVGDQAAGRVQARGNPGGCVNINSSSAQELQALPGIGPALSERIVAYRSENGLFARAEDLDSVSGVGITMINKIRNHICAIP